MAAPLPPKPPGHPLLKHAPQFVRDPFQFVEIATVECGDIYRMDLPAVDDIHVLTHPEQLRRALVTDVDSFGKTEDFHRAFGNGLLSTEGAQWRRQREVMQPLFFREQIRGYTQEMVNCTERRLGTWDDGESLDVEQEMRNLTLDVLFATLFGRKLVPGEDTDLREAADGLNRWFEPTSWILPPWVPTPARREFKQSRKRLKEEVRKLLSENSSKQIPRKGTPDLLSQLQMAHDSESGPQLSIEEIEDQLVTMVFAGHETTAAALGFIWYLLATHPLIRDRFHDELQTVLGGDSPTAESLAELELTDRIVTEALRLYPPIHTIPRRTKTDVEIDGFRIPEGEPVHLSVINAQRDKRFYDNPYEFQPDRWTGGFEEELHDFAYLPFGGGRRTCIGREFARLEAKIILATVGQQCQFEWDDSHSFEIEPQMTMRTKNGIPMTVTQR